MCLHLTGLTYHKSEITQNEKSTTQLQQQMGIKINIKHTLYSVRSFIQNRVILKSCTRTYLCFFFPPPTTLLSCSIYEKLENVKQMFIRCYCHFFCCSLANFSLLHFLSSVWYSPWEMCTLLLTGFELFHGIFASSFVHISLFFFVVVFWLFCFTFVAYTEKYVWSVCVCMYTLEFCEIIRRQHCFRLEKYSSVFIYRQIYLKSECVGGMGVDRERVNVRKGCLIIIFASLRYDHQRIDLLKSSPWFFA